MKYRGPQFLFAAAAVLFLIGAVFQMTTGNALLGIVFGLVGALNVALLLLVRSGRIG